MINSSSPSAFTPTNSYEGARVELEVEEFKKGTEVEEIDGGAAAAAEVMGERVERGLSATQVRSVLFDGKDFKCGDQNCTSLPPSLHASSTVRWPTHELLTC